MECSLPLDKQIAEGKRLQKRFYPPTGEFINIDFYCAFIAEEEEEIEMLLENYLQRSWFFHSTPQTLSLQAYEYVL